MVFKKERELLKAIRKSFQGYSPVMYSKRQGCSSGEASALFKALKQKGYLAKIIGTEHRFRITEEGLKALEEDERLEEALTSLDRHLPREQHRDGTRSGYRPSTGIVSDEVLRSRREKMRILKEKLSNQGE